MSIKKSLRSTNTYFPLSRELLGTGAIFLEGECDGDYVLTSDVDDVTGRHLWPPIRLTWETRIKMCPLIALSRDFCLAGYCGSHAQCKDVSQYPHFLCTCDPGYTGQYCDTQVTGSQSNFPGQTHTANTCDRQYCNHHGDCSEVNGQQTCHCHFGYSGNQCQHHACSECSLKGFCTGDTSDIQCQCYHGYYGSRCQHVYVHITHGYCTNSCSGKGTCYYVHGIPVCSCHHNYYGELCQHIFFTTTTSTTTTTTTTTTTIAPPANTVHHCDRSHCHGNGECEIIDGQRRCLCYQDFHGDTCQYRSSNHVSTDCHSEDCSHEGTCYMLHGRPHCQCYPNRYGDYCEYYDYCESVSPCFNGGTCVNQMDVNHPYICTCPYGREGTHCENASPITTTTQLPTSRPSTTQPVTSTTTQTSESSTTTTTTTPRSSTTAPTSSVTSTTAPTTTPPYPYSHCNKYSTVADLAHNNSVEQRTAFQCSSGSHTGSDAFVLDNCNVTVTYQWTQGRQVATGCSNIPAFTPIATFLEGTFSINDLAGVFIECLPNGFKIATQSCDQSPTILHIENGALGKLDPRAYFTVQ